jgi:hypothetical protein
MLCKRNAKRLLTSFIGFSVSVRVLCSDVYAALREGRRDLAQASGVISGI